MAQILDYITLTVYFLLTIRFSSQSKWYPGLDLPPLLSIPPDRSYTITSDADTVLIKSPGYPNAFPSYSKQSYTVSGSRYPLLIKATTFALQDPDSKGNCLGDRLAIWDSKYPYFILKIACGTTLFNLTSYSDRLVMLFAAGMSTPDRNGFQLSVTRAQCGQGDLVCPSDPTVCAAQDRICDGVPDCPNSEDEVCTSTCGLPTIPPRDMRIVGGIAAVPNSWPWQTYLSIAGAFCGGTVIGPQWVMTAAHCCTRDGATLPASQFTAFIGFTKCYPTIDASPVKIKAVYVHPFYFKLLSGVRNDFCLLQLETSQDFTGTVSPACLSRPYSQPSTGDTCYATGCGFTNANTGQPSQQPGKYATVLQQVDLGIVNHTSCGNSFPTVTPEMLCATRPGKDACQGDSGGPLVCHPKNADDAGNSQWQLSGITSFGIGCATNNPGVFANGRFFLPFLINVLYNLSRQGWFEDTSVPVINHSAFGQEPFPTRRLNEPDFKTGAVISPVVDLNFSHVSRANVCAVYFVLALLYFATMYLVFVSGF